MTDFFWTDSEGVPLVNAEGLPFWCSACPCAGDPYEFCCCGFESEVDCLDAVYESRLTVVVSGFSSGEKWGCNTRPCNELDGTYVFEWNSGCNETSLTNSWTQAVGPNQCQTFGGTLAYSISATAKYNHLAHKMGFEIRYQVGTVPPSGVPTIRVASYETDEAQAKPGGNCWRNSVSGTMALGFATAGTAGNRCTPPSTVSFTYELL